MALRRGAPRPVRSARARALAARLGRWVTATTYLKRWLFLGIVIGLIAGLGAVTLFEGLHLANHFLLVDLVGYRTPTNFSEGTFAGSPHPLRPWALPLVTGGGALAGALLVYWLAPEAEGHGTDAAIAAVHHNPTGVRFRAVVVKIVASALTIGSGGSAGREGPTGQVSAGFGSLLARVLDLSPSDARIAVSTGIGSGIGAIFGTPLGGAVLACEILYRDDFDATPLLPSFIASAVAYSIFGLSFGFSPIFGYAGVYHFTDPSHLGWFALIGVLGGLIGILYSRSFYGMAGLFERWRVPKWSKPALAGVVVGALGIVMPEVLASGYGWVQKALGGNLSQIPLWAILLLPFARILATSLSVGSGGSGGIFGPGLVIGAFVGASVWRIGFALTPSIGHNPAPYVIVGMMCTFGSVARAPLAVMLMVAEMTGSLSLLTPALVAVGIAWLIVRQSGETIYRSQLLNRAETTSSRLLAGLPLLATVSTRAAMARPRVVLRSEQSAEQARESLTSAHAPGAPVVDAEGRLEGVVALSALASEGADLHALTDAGAPTTSAEGHLDEALEALTRAHGGWITVVDLDRRPVGTLSISDVVLAYRRAVMTSSERLRAASGEAGFSEIAVSEDSPFAGKPLREAGLAGEAIVTSVTRGTEVLAPAADLVLEPGDRLTLLDLSL